jgi:WD40 repeat protein
VDHLQRDEAVARLQHPNIVQVYDVGAIEGRPYLALEFVAGGTLKQRLTGTPLPPREAAGLTEVVARAVEFAHRQGILHRDLKPANILLTRQGEAAWEGEAPAEPRPSGSAGASPSRAAGASPSLGTPKIADFGLAKLFGGDGGEGMTHSTEVVGTPSYMSPEQARPGAGVGPAADVYALGALLYELLTGRPPFSAATALETLLQITHADPVPVDRLRLGLPRDLATITMKCLEKDPRKRYASARELADDCAAFLEGRAIRARPVSSLERLWRWGRRNPALAVTAGVALLALVAVAVVSTLFALHALDAAEALRRQQGKTQAQAELAVARGRLAESRLADHYLDRALALANRDQDPARALVWLGAAAAAAPEDADLQRAIRINFAAWRPEVPALRALCGHHASTYGYAFSPDGRLVAQACRDNAGRLWDAAAGTPVGGPLAHADQVQGVAISRDGKTVLTGSWDGTARLWDTATGRPLGPPLGHGSPIATVALSPDGKTSLTGGGLEASLWDNATGRRIGAPMRHEGPVYVVALSPDGKTVATGSTETTPRLWNAATGLPIGPAPAQGGRIVLLSFSADGKRLLAMSLGGPARLWDAATGQPLGPPLAPPPGIATAALAPDGRTVLTGGWDGTGRLWDGVTGKPVADGALPPPFVLVTAFSPDGRTLLTAVGATARLWEKATGKAIGPPLLHEGPVIAAAFGADGKTFLTGTFGGTVRRWELPTGNGPVATCNHEQLVVAVAFSPETSSGRTGRRVLSSNLKWARVWDVATGKDLIPPLEHKGNVQAVAFSPDGRMVLTGEWDIFGCKAHLWDAATGKPIGQPWPSADQFARVGFRPDGKFALAVSPAPDGKITCWEVATGKQVPETEADPDGKVRASLERDPALSPDGSVRLRTNPDGTAELWDVTVNKQLGPPLRHGGGVTAMAFSPDGKLVVTGSRDGLARTWAIPAPVTDSAEGLDLGAQVGTGLEIDHDTVRVLDVSAWQERRRRLERVGGLP